MVSSVWVGGQVGWDYLNAADSGPSTAGPGVAGSEKIIYKTWSDTHTTGPCNFPHNIITHFQAQGDAACAHVHTHTSHLLGRLCRSV